MKKLFLSVLDIIFPCECVYCGDLISSSQYHLCQECYTLLKELNDACPVCSGILVDGICSICSDRKFYPAKNITLFSYENVSKAVIHSLKFNGIKHVYKIFIPYIRKEIEYLDEKIDIITSVPMSRKKMIKRGYNQSKLIAKELCKETGIEFCEILKENSGAKQQRSLNYDERFINVIDRYKTINNNKFKDKVVLIIDDVFTTGATINECSRKLISSGAAKIFSITLVRSDLKKLENI
ncbi:MAG: ComF family protein [Leptospirales bacterium]|nr:ComF family protein [Leptospirales bacterium]